jgi:FtsP/CotA-like multicopper oxidase with cupredoxin domain
LSKEIAATVVANDNRLPAGHYTGDTLELSLDITRGAWKPRGPADPGIDVEAFAETGKTASIPGPLLRVRSGTLVRVRLTNRLDKRVVVRGLYDRADRADSLVLAPRASLTHAFRARTPGTYLYVGRTTDAAAQFGRAEDEALSGAFVVDPRDQPPSDGERIMVMTAWDDTARDARYPAGYAQVFAINGLSWPYTERLSYSRGDTVRWRVLNATNHAHPMHLHGFFFTLLSQGTSAFDTLYSAGDERLEVTHMMRAGTSITLRWVAERTGNWLFHCHAINHIESALRVDAVEHGGLVMSHARVDDVMSGLVTALTVRPRAGATVVQQQSAPTRRLRLWITEGPPQAGDSGRRPLSFVLQEGAMPPRTDSVRRPGTTLVLYRGEPTQITVLNRSSQPSTVHWHGLELESYYDGVAGWSGSTSRTAPVIAPGDSFVVRITPPRAGTYIYHSHTDDRAQLAAGLYGALVVLPQKESERGLADRVVTISEHGIEVPGGSALTIDAGRVTRLRVVGISIVEPMRLQLVQDTTTMPWRLVAKDGADLPESQRRDAAEEVVIGQGETMDFELPATLTSGAALVLRFPGSPTRPAFRLPIRVP